MRKLSKIMESVWNDIRKKSLGQEEREENYAESVVIDGVKYKFTDDFWGMGDTYKEDEGYDWEFFSFNKMPDGSLTISGDTDAAGVFGRDKWDIDDGYDVHVLREYIGHSSEELAKKAIDDMDLYSANDPNVFPILERYVKEVFKHHMSEYAYFWVEYLRDSEMNDSMVISFCSGTNYAEVDTIRNEFDQEITKAHLYMYPMLDNWYEGLEKELIDEYIKNGWTKSETYEIDYDNTMPGDTSGLCFVRFD